MLIPPDPFRLRPMSLGDLDDVMAIDRLSFPTPSKAALFRYELEQNKLATYEVLALSGSDGAEKLLGFSGFWNIADEIHISTIAVDPTWRGTGLGELLLLSMLFAANDQSALLVTLEVRESNEAAQSLYEKYRFEAAGRRRRYYRDTGEDAVLMTVASLDAAYYHFLEQQKAALFAQLSGQTAGRPTDQHTETRQSRGAASIQD